MSCNALSVLSVYSIIIKFAVIPIAYKNRVDFDVFHPFPAPGGHWTIDTILAGGGWLPHSDLRYVKITRQATREGDKRFLEIDLNTFRESGNVLFLRNAVEYTTVMSNGAWSYRNIFPMRHEKGAWWPCPLRSRGIPLRETCIFPRCDRGHIKREGLSIPYYDLMYFQ